MADKQRRNDIDIAKGLLILMVVCGHFELMCRVCYHIEDRIVIRFDSIENLWCAFFMPAFFYLSGYCSTFSKRFWSFLSGNFKSILFPAFIITLCINLFDYISWRGGDPMWIVKTIIKNSLYNASGEWFIPSLFLARMITWFIQKESRISMRYIVALGLFMCGVVLYNSFTEIPNIWFFKHAFMVTIFVLIGNEMKTKKLHRESLISIVYLAIIIGMILSGIRIPCIANKIILNYQEVPILLLLATMGIISILYLSKLINHNRVLEYLGKNSLVIFLLHFVFYRIYLYLLMPYFGQNVFLSIVLILFVLLLNIASCCLCAWILNTRYLRWVLGKF